jgi:hypothetical protein
MNSIDGAAILAARFSELEGDGRDERQAPVQATGALPLFHWVGVEPPHERLPRAEGGADPSPENGRLRFLERASRRVRRAGSCSTSI